MTDVHRNYIAGEWVGRRLRQGQRNPSNVGDVIGEYAQADAAQTRAAIAAAKAAAPAWAAGSIQERSNLLDRVGTRNPRAQGRARPPAVARGRQDAARGHRRGGARGAHLQVLRRRSAAPRRRKAAVGAPRHRRRGDPRAGRRRRPHHAVEFSDRDSGVEDRAGARLRQHRRVQARRSRARLRVGAGRNPGEGGRPGGRVQPGDGTRLGRRRSAGQRPRRRGDQLHGLGRHRPRASPRRRSRAWRRSSSRWAARIRSSCWTTPTSRPRSTPRRRAPIFSTGQRCTASSRLIVTDRHPRSLRRGDDREAESAQGRRCAGRGHRHRAGGRPEPARAGPSLSRNRQGRRGEARVRRRAPEARDRRATTWRRRSSPRRTTACASRARRSSARSRA